VGAVVYKVFNKSDLVIDLPNSWFWDAKRRIKYRYKTSETDPPYYYLKVKPGLPEYNWFEQLIEKLDFGKLRIDSAYAVVSPILASSAGNSRQILRQRMKNSPAQFFSQSWKNLSDNYLRGKTMDHFVQKMMLWDWNTTIQDSCVLPVVHGTDENIAWKIAAGGFASLSLLDSGYYGKGIYFSTSAQYVIPYFGTKPNPTILICLAVPGNPYPVIEPPSAEENWSGKHLMSGYQSHYVITTKKGLPFTERDYKESTDGEFNELVLQQDAQVVPIFLVKIDNSNLFQVMQAFLREKAVLPIEIEKRRASIQISTPDSVLIPLDEAEADEKTFLIK